MENIPDLKPQVIEVSEEQFEQLEKILSESSPNEQLEALMKKPPIWSAK